jgi:hypothetical protein
MLAPIASRAALAALLSLALLLPAASFADGSPRIFRPLTADPRENQSRWRQAHYTEDWRYGTDITDSTSRGGWDRGREGKRWDVGGGETLRWRPLRSLLGWRGPWTRYQLGLPVGVSALFDQTASEINVDYQFGVSLDALWRGDWSDETGLMDWSRTVVTSRTVVFHRSSHLGDEYLTHSWFGRNTGWAPGVPPVMTHPPVKRFDLSYEAFRQVVSLEFAQPLPLAPASTWRAYGGVELKIVEPSWLPVGGLRPSQMTSPVWQLGGEWRSGGAHADAGTTPFTSVLNWATRTHDYGGEWIVAADLALAKPFDFADADNPAGGGEAWTPLLWTAAPYGHEFRHYAGTWHGMAGIALSPRRLRDTRGAGRFVAPEAVIALEWQRGYATEGQLVDQRLRYRPRGYVLPTVTLHF